MADNKIYFAYGPVTPRTNGYGVSVWYDPPYKGTVSPYTESEVSDALCSETRTVWFDWWLLSQENVRLRKIHVFDADVVCEGKAQIQRSMGGTIRAVDADGIIWTKHRLQPVFCIKMPDGGTYEEPIGVFLPSTPERKTGETHTEIYIEGYDIPIILSEDRFTSTTTIPAGTGYLTSIQTIIQQAGIPRVIFEPTNLVLETDVTFEIGTDRLTAANTLLAAIGYAPLYADENGDVHCNAQLLPYDRAIRHRYIADEKSVIRPEITTTLDLFSIPNVFVASVSIPDGPPLVSVYENKDPLSPLSTAARARRVVAHYALDNIANQDALDQYVRIRAYEASAAYGRVSFSSRVMPGHGVNDVLYIMHPRGDVDGRFEEVGWTLDMTTLEMQHTAERVILV